MNFLHVSLLAGLAAMAIPVAMHLLSRRQPKLIAFPALRLVKHTVVQQRGSWQLRHFLLLCLRVTLLGAMALALARPRVHSAMLSTALGLGVVAVGAIFATLVALIGLVTRRGPAVWIPASLIAAGLWLTAILWTSLTLTGGPVVLSSDQTAPVAAAIIIDSGPSLDYRAENDKRFEAAKKMATWILSQLPLDSRVGVLTGVPIGSLGLDPATAKGQVNLLQPQAMHVDLAARLRTAIDLVGASDLERKEIYVLTDLMKPAWSSADASLTQLMKEHQEEILVQIIDVGAESSINWRLGDLQLESQSVPNGGSAVFQISVAREAQTPGGPVTVKLVQEQMGVPLISDDTLKLPPAWTVDQANVDLTEATDATLTLKSPSLIPGSHNFRIELNTADPLGIDNVRYSTITCAAQASTLVVADDADAARLLKLALTPDGGDPAVNQPGDSAPQAAQIRSSQIDQAELERYGVVYINDPPALTPSTVAALESFVEQGGGLFLALGPALGSVDEAQAAALQKLLPGPLARVTRRPRDDDSLFLVPASTTHRLFQVYESVAADVPWNLFPIHRIWEIDQLQADSQVLINTTDLARAALIMQRRGAGQILTLLTPLPSLTGNQSWNDLLAGSDPWPAYGLILGAARVLSGHTPSRFNCVAGESVALDNDPKEYPVNYILFSPDGSRRTVRAESDTLVLGSLEQAGTYRLRGLQGSQTIRGVSVNTPSADTQLNRLTSAELDTLLGNGSYRLARKESEVESSVGQARYGRELFPLLMACVAAIFLAEQAMSNRFYKLRWVSTESTPLVTRKAARSTA